MERKLATIRKIDDIKPIEGADAIECAVLDGWEVVVKKDEFKVGDKVLYLEIDSWVPNKLAPFLTKEDKEPKEYKGIQGERLRTVKLRGQISQGLVIPIPNGITENDDIDKKLGIIKWEPDVPANLKMGDSEGEFPSFLVKTDQERLQNRTQYFNTLKDKTFEVTVKVDGSSMTVYHYKGEVAVCSRNMKLRKPNDGTFWIKIQKNPLGKKFVNFIKEHFFKYKPVRKWLSKYFNTVQTSTYWNEAIKNKLPEKLREYGKDIAIQMELYGEGIQKNPEGIKGTDIAIFDVYLIKEHRYATPSERMKILEDMNLTDKHTRILGYYKMPSDIKVALEMASGPSIHNPKEREGIVFKGVDTPISFKVISNEYLLKHSDR